jgi:DNA topoisomerase-1
VKLVIVESPAKAKTIEKFLGKGYRVVASYGHIRDLPSSADEIPAEFKKEKWARLAVDVEDGYKPIYVVSSDNRKRISDLKKLVKDAEEIILATDEDREGESISWHLLEILKPSVPVQRIVFHEITQAAIDEAIANPREVDMELVRAQESRRILDRLFGYSLSPVLWKKIRPRLAAGRVQSPAVRLVVEREEERRAFRKAEYWDIDARLAKADNEFTATLVSVSDRRIASGKDFDAETGELNPKSDILWLREEEARSVAASLETHTPWKAARVGQKPAKLRPDPPLITSSLQRAASGLLGFAPKRTMSVAQRLYEGVNLGGGDREGLITYMRTDSVTLSQDALSEARWVICDTFGEKFHQIRTYATKSKLAQEAHEAIRPTKLGRTPEEVAKYPDLDEDAKKLYRLIWRRTLASQMADAQLLKTTIEFETEIDGGTAVLRSNGSVVTFPGFLRVADSSQKDTVLPDVKQGDNVVCAEDNGFVSQGSESIAMLSVEPLQHETKPRARYTEASLIQRLEEEGIGRPSTYAPTITAIQKHYVDLKGKALVPTYVAIATTQMLREHFSEYADLNFTARMEDALDNIASGQQKPVEFLDSFYRGKGDFGKGLESEIEKKLPEIDFPVIALGEDPDTGKPWVVRPGKTTPFVQRGEGGAGNTASIPEDLTFEDLDVEKAAALLEERAKGDEPIGVHPDTGEKIYFLVGRFGPYLQLGEVTEENKKPRRASLSRGITRDEMTLPLALKLLSLPRVLGEHPESKEEVSAAIGRFGPYVKQEKEFRSLEDTDDVYTVTLERALHLLAQPKKSRRATKKIIATLGNDPNGDGKIEVIDGRYGPYVSNGEVNATVPKDKDPAKVTLAEALDLVDNAPKRKKKVTKKKAKSKTKSKAKPRAKA